MIVRVCKQCKFSRKLFNHYGTKSFYCVRDAKFAPDRVNGVYFWDSARLCSESRQTGGVCGPAGEHFVKKRSWWEELKITFTGLLLE